MLLRRTAHGRRLWQALEIWMAFIRFVIPQNDKDSGRRQGLFQAISDLEHEGVLLSHEQATYDQIYEWFRKHLRRPSRLARASKAHAKNMALSWFKGSAAEHIRKMHEISEILRAHGVTVDVIRTDRPGYVVYEDAYQVAAEPFNDTGA
jgi:hypothetical protein